MNHIRVATCAGIRTYSKLGNYQQAIEDYSKAIKLTPELAEAYLARGFAYFKLGNDEQSINDAKIAASLGHKKAQNALKKQGIVNDRHNGATGFRRNGASEKG